MDRANSQFPQGEGQVKQNACCPSQSSAEGRADSPDRKALTLGAVTSQRVALRELDPKSREAAEAYNLHEQDRAHLAFS
jgi:hypothetical protein